MKKIVSYFLIAALTIGSMGVTDVRKKTKAAVGDTHSISYIGNLGDNPTYPSSYIEGTGVTLQNPTRTGYNFLGWTGSNGSIPQKNLVISRTDTENKTFTTNWEAIEYAITYAGVEKSPEEMISKYTIETPTFSLTPPTRTGYTFLGWTGSNGSTPQATVTIAKGTVGNKSYKANWNTEEVTVRFNTAGGSCDIASKTVKYTEEYGVLPTPIRTDYIFLGWYDQNDRQITPDTMVDTKLEHVLTAKWSPVSPVVLDHNGGTSTMDSIILKQGDFGKRVVVPTRQYTVTFDYKNAKPNVTQKYKAEFLGYFANNKMYFNESGTQIREWNEAPGTKLVALWDSIMIELPTVKIDNYQFTGWSDSDGNKVSSPYILSNDTTLTANLAGKECKIVLNPAGGRFVNITGIELSVPNNYYSLGYIHCIANSYIELPVLVKDGYVFKGWALKGAVVQSMKAEDATLTAVWQKLESEIKNAQTNNQELLKAVISDSVKEIGVDYFKNCYNLTDVTLHNSIVSIGSAAFENCYELKSIKVPDSVGQLGSYAFNNCSKLETVILGEKVTKVDETTFRNCKNLKKVTINNPNIEIADGTFSPTVEIVGGSCSNAKDFASKNKNKFIKNATTYEVSIYTTPDEEEDAQKDKKKDSKEENSNKDKADKTYISKLALSGKTEEVYTKGKKNHCIYGVELLDFIKIDDSVKDSEFIGYALVEDTILKNRVTGDKLTIARGTLLYGKDGDCLYTSCDFASNVSLVPVWESIKGYLAGTSIADENDSGANGEKEVTPKPTKSKYVGKVVKVSKFTIKLGSTNAKITKIKASGKLVIPTAIKYKGLSYNITEISKNAAKGQKITSLTTGSKLKTIGASAFYNCGKLKQISLGSGITVVHSKAFANCKQLRGLSIVSKKVTFGSNVVTKTGAIVLTASKSVLQIYYDKLSTTCRNVTIIKSSMKN